MGIYNYSTQNVGKKHLTEIVKDKLLVENNPLIKNQTDEQIERKLNVFLTSHMDQIQFPLDNIM